MVKYVKKKFLKHSGYDTKLHQMVRLQFQSPGECESLFVSITPELVVYVRVVSMGQIDLFLNYQC